MRAILDTSNEDDWKPPQSTHWYITNLTRPTLNQMSQTIVKQGYDITTADVEILVADLRDFTKREGLYGTIKNTGPQSNIIRSLRASIPRSWLRASTCPRLSNSNIPTVFHEAAAGTIWKLMLSQVRQYGKVKSEKQPQTPAPV
ncbi:hypothetical protein J1614_007240 [Plenodomus biglobosus]|nr:hypothetical protein J1614_007240 [Plenodomus biglobosus]